MTLSPEEFMRRFLLHVLPSGFHRIRHYGLLANGSRRLSLAAARQLLEVHADVTPAIAGEAAANDEPDSKPPTFVCRHCGRPMVIVLLLAPQCSIRAPPRVATR
jgi:Putative transposase